MKPVSMPVYRNTARLADTDYLSLRDSDLGERFFPLFMQCFPVSQSPYIRGNTRFYPTQKRSLHNQSRSVSRPSRDACDNAPMSRDHDEPEQFPIAYSTAYLGLAALLTIRDDPDEHYGSEATRYATHVLELIKAQPETVLHLPPSELEQTGPLLIDNSETWLT